MVLIINYHFGFLDFYIDMFRKDLYQNSKSNVVKLPFPTNSSMEIIKFVLQGLENIFVNSEMNMTPDDIRKIQETYPNLSTWQIFKATKECKFLGQSDLGHLCQAELVCEDGFCQAHKNRFGGNIRVGIDFYNVYSPQIV